MAKTTQTPVSVLKSYMDEFELNPYSLSKAISLSPSAVRQILVGKSKITVPTALRLAKFFGETPVYWLDLQREVDLSEAEKDKELADVLKGISKAKKDTTKAKPEATAKPAKRTAKAEKQKAKDPSAKPATRKQKK